MERIWKNTFARHLSILLVFIAAPLFAESFTGGQNNNPFQTASPSATPPAASPQSNPGDAHFFSSTSNVIDNSAGNDANGREYKLGDAQRQAGAGTGAAVASGSALTAAGMTQLALMNFPEAARLFGLAGMEFAQAGADTSSNTANGNQRATLLANAGQDGTQAQYDPTAAAQSLLTPDARQALQSQGINPDSFMSALTSGNIRSGSDALAALGKDVPPDQAASINDYSGIDLSKFMPAPPEGLGSQTRQALGVDESAKSNPLGGGNASATTGAAGNGALTNPGANAQANAASSSASALQTKEAGAAAGAAGANGKGAAGADRDLASLPDGIGYMGILGLLDKNTDPVAAALNRAKLLDLGITKPMRGQNIFRVAFRNYRSFSKWRAKSKADDVASAQISN